MLSTAAGRCPLCGQRKRNLIQTENQLLRRIREEGSYTDVRALEDGTIIGIGDLLFTKAIYIDLSETGWGQRFCFKDAELARDEYMKLRCGDEEPKGYIARRPDYPCNRPDVGARAAKPREKR
jgi:hypothetical protein